MVVSQFCFSPNVVARGRRSEAPKAARWRASDLPNLPRQQARPLLFAIRARERERSRGRERSREGGRKRGASERGGRGRQKRTLHGEGVEPQTSGPKQITLTAESPERHADNRYSNNIILQQRKERGASFNSPLPPLERSRHPITLPYPPTHSKTRATFDSPTVTPHRLIPNPLTLIIS